jgi:hypothetical protein
MNLNEHIICDDWGWYVDTESNLSINSNIFHANKYYTNKYQNNKYYKKINDCKLIKLCTINEVVEEYDYYKKNYLEIAKIQLECSSPKTEKKEKNDYHISLYKIGSTTLITGLLTYAIFFLI